nr:hypothetical protein [Tanacetum cinerariifolium]
MDAPTLPVSAKKNLRDPIEIRVDIVHPAPANVFLAATVEMNALRFRMGMAEEENASLRGWIKTIEAIDTITRRQEKRARMELERQLASVQESQRQDQENFRKLQEIMPTTRQGANVFMTLEAVQAMIDRTLLRNTTTDDGSQNSGGGPRRPMQPARVCSYTDFMKCQPFNFKGAEGIVGLSQWVEKMESVFHISGCAVENQVKFTTCTLLGAALTWWNGHVRTLGHDTAYAMTLEILKKKLTDKYCPKDKLRTRELDNNNQAQQQLLKKQNVVQAYAVGTGEKKSYRGSKPLCPKCNYHHDGECAPKSDCPVLKNQGTEARGMVYALGGRETNQDLDNTEDDINA